MLPTILKTLVSKVEMTQKDIAKLLDLASSD